MKYEEKKDINRKKQYKYQSKKITIIIKLKNKIIL